MSENTLQRLHLRYAAVLHTLHSSKAFSGHLCTFSLAPGSDHVHSIIYMITFRYLPIGGLKEFNKVSVKLAYGDSSPAIQDARVAAVQSLSGTGSCRLMAEFMQRWMQGSKVLCPHLATMQ